MLQLKTAGYHLLSDFFDNQRFVFVSFHQTELGTMICFAGV